MFIGLVVALTIRTDDVRRCEVDDGLTAPLLDGARHGLFDLTC